jgi:glycosyltransferase involved in cell wall biosynthesis
MSTPALLVALCAHNPRPEFLRETLDALRRQTLPAADWELLVVDNASTPSLASRTDLPWPGRTRFVREERLGIAPARARALRELAAGSAGLLLFLDDDNLLAPDYLATGLRIAVREPGLGCWGGQLLPRFLAPPPDWIGPFLKYLAVFPLEHELRLARFSGNYDPVPPTAGLFLRRAVALRYLALLDGSPARLALGGDASLRVGGEDMDLALTALDLGFELARLPALTLTHLIPPARLTEAYVATLLRGATAGSIILASLRGAPSVGRPRWRRWLLRLRARRLPARHRRFLEAELDGEVLAHRILRDRRLHR